MGTNRQWFGTVMLLGDFIVLTVHALNINLIIA